MSQPASDIPRSQSRNSSHNDRTNVEPYNASKHVSHHARLSKSSRRAAVRKSQGSGVDVSSDVITSAEQLLNDLRQSRGGRSNRGESGNLPSVSSEACLSHVTRERLPGSLRSSASRIHELREEIERERNESNRNRDYSSRDKKKNDSGKDDKERNQSRPKSGSSNREHFLSRDVPSKKIGNENGREKINKKYIDGMDELSDREIDNERQKNYGYLVRKNRYEKDDGSNVIVDKDNYSGNKHEKEKILHHDSGITEFGKPLHGERTKEFSPGSITDRKLRANKSEVSLDLDYAPAKNDNQEEEVRQTIGEGSEKISKMMNLQVSQDPPTCDDSLTGYSSPALVDPNEELGSVYRHELRKNDPPTPTVPKRENCCVISEHGQYANYRLDDSDLSRSYLGQQEENKSSMLTLPMSNEQYLQHKSENNDRLASMRIQHDPPEGSRGGDVPDPHVPLDPPITSSQRNVIPRRSPRVRSSRSSKRVDDITNTESAEPKQQKPEIKGILKKKGSTPPIAYFGKPVSKPPDPDLESYDNSSSESSPSFTEYKDDRIKTDNLNDSVSTKITNSKSGLRSGRFATINAAAVQPVIPIEDFNEDSYEERADNEVDDDNTLSAITTSYDERFDRARCHYLRTSDLGLTQDTIFPEQFLDHPNAKPEPHFHHPTPHPPPSVQFHVDENWIAIDDGKGGHSPIAPQAVDALVVMGYRAACDPIMWTPTKKTRNVMTEKGLRFDDIPIPGPLNEGEGGPSDTTCLVWSGNFLHRYYGSDVTAFRSQGIINMSPEELVDLLMDSTRVNEYNKSSIGRTDEVTLSDGTNHDNCPFSGQRKKKLTGVVMEKTRIVNGVAIMDSQSEDERSEADDDEVFEEVFDDHGGKSVQTMTTLRSSGSRAKSKHSKFVGVTKLVRSRNKPPLLRKNLEFITLLHCRALTDDQGGDGYIVVGRAVTPAEDAEKNDKSVKRSEVLLNVHIIKRIKAGKGRNVVTSLSGKPASKSELANRCLLINVNHLKCPLIPNLLAKKVGLSAAVNFISEIRSLT